MSHPHRLYRLLVGILVASLLLGPAQVPISFGCARRTCCDRRDRPVLVIGSLPDACRSRDPRARRAPLEELEVAVLSEGPGWAVVLADGDQLESLARLRFEPLASDDLAGLTAAAGPAKAWLTEGLQPLLAQAEAVQQQRAMAATASVAAPAAVTALRAAMQAITPEQAAGITALPSNDFDGDGLTDTEEAWWCTDPANPNSDGDALGSTDGQEVAALLDFTLPRTVRWGYGPPFGPPNAWPNFNDRNGTHVNVCNDGDYDTIPDYAEVYMVGTRVPEESTDGDKFDDGQELFGVTYCPGGDVSCGYGAYPRIEYWNYIKATMPNWVLPPGDNPLVAAFPIPEVSVVEGSWKVERVTTITTQQGQMTQASKTYGSEARKGQRTSVADTQTWNEWEEVSKPSKDP